MNENKIDRVAVLLIGELRTWEHSSKYIINSISTIAKQIDWFLVTWDTDKSSGEPIHVSDRDVLLPFEKNNVKPKNYKILPIIAKERTTFFNNAWLSKVANILKRQTERIENFVYDNVIECRVDLYLRKVNKSYRWCNEFEIVGPQFQHVEGIMASPDLYFRSGSYTNDILSNRYAMRPSESHYTITSQVYTKFNNHHWVLYQYIKNKLLSEVYWSDFGSGIIPLRDNFPMDKNLDEISIEKLNELFNEFKTIWNIRKLNN